MLGCKTSFRLALTIKYYRIVSEHLTQMIQSHSDTPESTTLCYLKSPQQTACISSGSIAFLVPVVQGVGSGRVKGQGSKGGTYLEEGGSVVAAADGRGAVAAETQLREGADLLSQLKSYLQTWEMNAQDENTRTRMHARTHTNTWHASLSRSTYILRISSPRESENWDESSTSCLNVVAWHLAASGEYCGIGSGQPPISKWHISDRLLCLSCVCTSVKKKKKKKKKKKNSDVLRRNRPGNEVSLCKVWAGQVGLSQVEVASLDAFLMTIWGAPVPH